ncbi:MAG: hypothetical protein ACRCWI_00005 [Brevinema sp.]
MNIQYFLTIHKTHIHKNFAFEIIRTAQKLNYTTIITLPKKYFPNQPFFPEQDLHISIQFDSNPKSLIFSGKIASIAQQSSSIIIYATFAVSSTSDFFETYAQSSFKNIINHLDADSTYENSQKQEAVQQEFVFTQSKRSSLHRNLSGKFFFINAKNKLMIYDNPIPKKQVYPKIKSSSFESFTVEPIPNIEICDFFVYKEQKFFIKGITYKNRVMILHVCFIPE